MKPTLLAVASLFALTTTFAQPQQPGTTKMQADLFRLAQRVLGHPGGQGRVRSAAELTRARARRSGQASGLAAHRFVK
jgi:hypothetical protein